MIKSPIIIFFDIEWESSRNSIDESNISINYSEVIKLCFLRMLRSKIKRSILVIVSWDSLWIPFENVSSSTELRMGFWFIILNGIILAKINSALKSQIWFALSNKNWGKAMPITCWLKEPSGFPYFNQLSNFFSFVSVSWALTIFSHFF